MTTNTAHNLASPTDLLRAAYKHLEFDQGTLLTATRQPQLGALGDWLDSGDWQSLAAQVGAETVFFVDRDPVVVFARSDDGSLDVLRKLYEKIWCMSRPQLLFLASPGQLAIYDLTKPPPRPKELLDRDNRLLAIASSMAEVQSKLAAYHRERIETGAVFGEDRFRDSVNRADRALIRDLKTVRHQLATLPVQRGQKRPELRHLHSLIGRAIFVRYLEDREILVPAYFDGVAGRRQAWQKLLAESPTIPALEPRMAELRFLRVLKSKEFTYALFNQLADDFNGDTFPIEDGEADCIQQEHLDKLRGFLLGTTSAQQELFFFAYRFDVIPIELISAIYEEFYNEQVGKDRNQGSHYTPPALVEFVLVHTLTPEVLATKPRVLDSACGSGIFLVESFRRIVRHLWAEQNGRRVSRPQLRKILREQIAGIDINEEAVRVAAFSLYLAFLHYQEPREINAERRLPYLKWVPEKQRESREKQMPGAQFYDVLLHANAFEVISGALTEEVTRRFGPGSATVVVGNPPWGYPKKEDKDGHEALAQTLKWCDAKKGRPIGDKELSQAFIHLTLAILQQGGRAGLLVSSGVLYKHHPKSREFRRIWLNSARLEHVVNFAHVRQIFFSSAQREAQGISPFLSVVFERTIAGPPTDNNFQYWSAKRTATIENTKCVVLNRGDMHWLSQRDCLTDERMWKIYWWGGHRDDALVRRLGVFSSLIQLPDQLPGVKLHFGRGFEVTKSGSPSDWLKDYRELPSKSFVRYGQQPLTKLRAVPARVYRKGLQAIYSGHRLLVARGIKSGGIITARLETKKYCFRNSIHGVRFEGLEKWQEAVITAVFWSSLARYFYFTTSGSWGFWHDEIHLEDVERMPICFPRDKKLRNRIVKVVGELQKLDMESENFGLFRQKTAKDPRKLEDELDEAIFELYELTAAERDLIRERCSIGLDLFYQHHNGEALREVVHPTRNVGTLSDLPEVAEGLTAYLRTFLEVWNDELAPDGEFEWRVLSPPSRAPLLAICFTTRYKQDKPPSDLPENNIAEWSNVLALLQQTSLVHGGAPRIFIDTFFRHVSDREILFIKRNERRFWTRTAAREDAESALTHLMNLEDVVSGDKQ
jgi:type I restriction-modification system DNA methylase subunit